MKAQFMFSIHVIALWSLIGIQPQINPEQGPGKPISVSISDEGPVQGSQFTVKTGDGPPKGSVLAW